MFWNQAVESTDAGWRRIDDDCTATAAAPVVDTALTSAPLQGEFYRARWFFSNRSHAWSAMRSIGTRRAGACRLSTGRTGWTVLVG